MPALCPLTGRPRGTAPGASPGLPVLVALLVALSAAQSVIAQEAPPRAVAVSPGTPQIVARADQIQFFPCNQCHQFLQSNPEIRTLMAPHVAELEHGGGRIWCLNCHDGTDRDQLVTLLGEVASFDQAPLVCGGCHARRYRDWQFGAHGKRAAQWQGERVVYSCPHCHNPHTPGIQPRAPQPPPPVRHGLERPEQHSETREPVWASRESEPAP